MKCRECGAETRAGWEDWPYPDLPGVTLCGVEIRRCMKNAEHHEVALPHMDDLHRTLAGALVAKRARLAGAEIRFLRELCGWDATKLATLLDVTSVSLSRWENDQTGHSGMADRLIRVLTAQALGLPVLRDVLEHIGDATAPSRVALRFGPGGWQVVDESDPVSVWISFADEDREAVIRVLEGSLEALKAALVRLSHHGGTEGRELATGVASDPRTTGSDPGRALQVAVDTLRALRPPPERSRATETPVEP